MPRELAQNDESFERDLDSLLRGRMAGARELEPAVSAILDDVRVRGDAALIALTLKFDRTDLRRTGIAFTKQEIDAALAACPKPALAALKLAAQRVADYHKKQSTEDRAWTDRSGVKLGFRFSPLAAVGLYVPGGTAAYPSSVLMNAVPAKVAGVGRLAMVVPTPDGKINPLVLAAARIAGIDEIYRIGGAQAVAALAYGTKSIARVDKIVGPGNAYVAIAKRMVFGEVGIDTIAGPSEVTVVADAKNDPAWIAADLMAQAEHDAAAQAILITDDRGFAKRVIMAVEHLLNDLARADIARRSWALHGAVIVVDDLADTPAIVDRIAPEHLQLAVQNPDKLAAKIRNAGAIFLGRFVPEALGDYLAGPSHVLPTSGAARFSSGLGVADFMKRTSLIGGDRAMLEKLAQPTIALAEAEGLTAHARSVAVRLAGKRK